MNTQTPVIEPVNRLTADNLAEVVEIKHFLLTSLLDFETAKVNNSDIVRKLIDDLTDAKTIKQMINLLEDAPNTKGFEESIRLQTLLYTLRKQVEKRDALKAMGVSEIYPDAKPENNNLSIKTIEELQRYLETQPDVSHLMPLEIVTVYGEIKKYGNIYGHAILKIGDIGYLHIDNLWALPTFISRDGLKAKLKNDGIFVVDVQRLTPKNSEYNAATVIAALNDYANHRWFWKMTHHNCLSFARKVAQACGINKDVLGHLHHASKLPIKRAMELDKLPDAGQANRDSKNTTLLGKLNKHISHIADNVNASYHAGKQLIWKNNFRPEHSRVNIAQNPKELRLMYRLS